jgi:hypothetical protein
VPRRPPGARRASLRTGSNAVRFVRSSPFYGVGCAPVDA